MKTGVGIIQLRQSKPDSEKGKDTAKVQFSSKGNNIFIWKRGKTESRNKSDMSWKKRGRNTVYEGLEKKSKSRQYTRASGPILE